MMDDVNKLVTLWRSRGMTLSGIADRLAANGLTNDGKPYTARDVGKLLPQKEKGPTLSLAERRKRRIDNYDQLREAMTYLRSRGLKIKEIADRLNAAGHRTVSGCRISCGLVSVLLRRPLW